MDNLIDFEDLASLLSLEKASISEYPALELLAELAVPSMEDFLGVKLEQTERTETVLLTTPTRMIPLDAIPVVSVDSIELDGGAITNYTITDYGLRLPSKISGDELVVIYTGGYLDPPQWLRRAVTFQVAYEWQSKDHIGAETVSNAGGSVQRPSLQLLKHVKEILRPHMHSLNRLN